MEKEKVAEPNFKVIKSSRKAVERILFTETILLVLTVHA
jgi:hypothetical protein